jgi:predicted outer membrane repeat protein
MLLLFPVMVLMALSQQCAGPPPPGQEAASVTRTQVPETVVSIRALEDVAHEGEGATEGNGESFTVRVSRYILEGDLAVTLEVGGDADLGRDYALRGAASTWSTQMKATIPDGQASVDLTAEVLNDVAAEADESIILTLVPGEGYRVAETASSATIKIPQNDFAVTTTADAGEGSLRQAIINANMLYGANTITFDTTIGPFAEPETIMVAGGLPDIVGEVTIDGYIKGRLWKPSGVTLRGGNQGRIFTVTPGAMATIASLTVADGYARDGGGILNRGGLVVKGVTFVNNAADHSGGALANLGGILTVINSTFADNSAGGAGGGLADSAGKVTVTNCTFSGNRAAIGGGIFSDGTLLVRNTILANSENGSDCVCVGELDAASTNNIIEDHTGCGDPITSADPILTRLDRYNGPTPTIPPGGGSPAINMGDNASAVDEFGQPLKWDQRGDGDPRYVAGYTDIGAFEQQASARLVVDTFEDSELRGCRSSGPADCSLRGAINLAIASGKPQVITFDPRVFDAPRTILLAYPLPELLTDVTIDASGTPGVTVTSNGRFPVLRTGPEAEVQLIEVQTDDM